VGENDHADNVVVWHVDEAMTGSNTSDKAHYHLALVDAGGNALLNGRGDANNPFPGNLKRRDFTSATIPNSKSYAGQDTFVSVTNISDPGRGMKMHISVSQGRASKL
jgi:immune inhibitor A